MAHPLRNMLMAAQQAARAKANAAEFHKAIEAAKDDYPGLTPQQKVGLAMATIVSTLVMLGLFFVGRH